MYKKTIILIALFCFFFLRNSISQDISEQISRADSLYNKGIFIDAAVLYEKIAIDELSSSELTSSRISELLHLAGLSYYSAGNYAKAIENFEKVVSINDELNNETNVALTYNNIGMVYNTWQKTDKAIEYYKKSLDIIISVDNKSQTAIILNNLGIIYNSLGNHTEAIHYFFKALEIDKELNFPVDIANDYNNIGIAYKSSGQFDKAINYFQLGISKYQTLDSNNDLLKIMNNLSLTYSEAGKYDSALVWMNKYDEITDRSGVTAVNIQSLLSKGNIYLRLKQFDKAKDYYSQALELSLKQNDQSNAINAWKGSGNVHFALADYSKAIEYYSIALENEVKAQNFGDASKTNIRIGDIYMAANNINEALVSYKNAYDLAVKTGNSECIATSSNNIGKVYSSWGKYDKAVEFFHTALNDALKNNNQNDIAESYNNIGLIYKAWGRYDDAIDYYNKALDINLKHKQAEKIAIRYNNIGACYQKKGDLTTAFDYFNKAMNYAQQAENKNLIAVCYTNFGFYYKSMGDNLKALENFKQAMEIDLKIGKESNIASDYNNIGTIYISNNDFVNAQEYFFKALEIDDKLMLEADMAIDYNNLGASYIGLSQFDKAIECLLKAVNLKEKLRKTASPDSRREYFESQINTYNDLIYAYLSVKDIPNAFKTIELSKAKLLAERISKSDSTINIFSLAEIQRELDEKTAIIVYATINREDLTIMLITKNNVTVKKNNKKAFVDKVLKNFDVEIKSYIYDQLPENLKGNQLLLNKEIKSRKQELEAIIQFYRKLLFIPNPDKITKEKSMLLGKLLYEFLLSPVETYLAGNTSLIIEPDGILGFLPFETLINKDNHYLVEQTEVSYTPSLSILNLIKKRIYSADRKCLLAIGGAIYNSATYNNDMKISDLLLKYDSLNFTITKGTLAKYLNEEQIKYLQKKTTEAINNKSSLKNIYNEMGYGYWANLPGSLAEIRVLSRIIQDCDTITANDVNENYIKSLSLSGKLKNYKIIHFSTHGVGISEIPELSAIILNPENNNIEDGYLRMGEISELNLNADFVNLSACETGLGKIYSGEGVVGLSQAFIIAGANGISASLWQVNDKSTAQFMIDVFTLAKTENISYMQAINKAKRLFIEGKHSEKWRSPYYWAPFIYYGN
jgi:tetratricopeptide (TPR) repeat protein/CHAT domain-containing protein